MVYPRTLKHLATITVITGRRRKQNTALDKNTWILIRSKQAQISDFFLPTLEGALPLAVLRLITSRIFRHIANKKRSSFQEQSNPASVNIEQLWGTENASDWLTVSHRQQQADNLQHLFLIPPAHPPAPPRAGHFRIGLNHLHDFIPVIIIITIHKEKLSRAWLMPD